MTKRVLDVTLSTIVLALASPLFVVLAVAVKLSSRGPVFHQACRVGRDGVAFRLLKFRSMRADAAQTGPAITRKGDDRVTPIGHLLRRSKLDELPQLINVVRGEMSLVGPRPEDPRFVALYSPEQRRLLTLRPGLTSRASIQYRHEEQQLCGGDWERQYVETLMPRKLALDLELLEPSLLRDLAVLGRTALALFR